MQKLPHEQLFEENLITQEQFEYLNKVNKNELVSVFYELRTMLYLGVMLFTTGAGMLVYYNIGQIGHYIALLLLTLICVASFYYVFKHQIPYSNERVNPPTPYLDYVLLLGSLLLLSIQGYLHFLTNIFENNWAYISLVDALIFFVIAYRFDHVGILSLAITAFTSFWGISVSPQEWTSNYSFKELYVTAIIIGAIFGIAAYYSAYKNIKKHFSFTYFNFAFLLFLSGTLTPMFTQYPSKIFLLVLFLACVNTVHYAHWQKSFLFLIYAFLGSYICVTYLLVILTENFNGAEIFTLWFLYSMFSCGMFIYFIIKYRNFYKED